MLQAIANISTNVTASALGIYQRPCGRSRLSPFRATLDQMLQLKRSTGQLCNRITTFINAAVINGCIAIAHVRRTGSCSGSGNSSASTSSSACTTCRQLWAGTMRWRWLKQIGYVAQAEILHHRLWAHPTWHRSPLSGQMRCSLARRGNK